MGYSRYIGRVGALAVALGIGVALANGPATAWADGDDGSSSGRVRIGFIVGCRFAIGHFRSGGFHRCVERRAGRQRVARCRRRDGGRGRRGRRR